MRHTPGLHVRDFTHAIGILQYVGELQPMSIQGWEDKGHAASYAVLSYGTRTLELLVHVFLKQALMCKTWQAA